MRVLKFIDEQFEKWALIASLIVMVLLTFMQVVLRWFGNATVWAEELSRYIMLYQVWVGASYAVHEPISGLPRWSVSCGAVKNRFPRSWCWPSGWCSLSG